MTGVEVHIRLKPVASSAWTASDTVLFRHDARFAFGRVHPAAATNTTVYASIDPYVTAVFGGQNVTVLAYGQTGSGKTHSMLGSDGDRGFIPRAAEALLKLVQSRPGATLRGSCIEIYNETVRDLLAGEKEVAVTDAGPGGGVSVDRSSQPIASLSDFVVLSNRAETSRKYANTDMNDRSSRSHTILSFDVYPPNQTRQCSTINFVDLAGSESTAKSNTAGQQLREGNFINKSLLALGNVVDAIIEGRSHVPYRESKLTRVLRTCLGGRSLAYILTCVNPSAENVAETTAALRFAQRAMKIKNDPTLTLQCPPLVCQVMGYQVAQVCSEQAAVERAAFAKGLEDTYTGCNATIANIVVSLDGDAEQVTTDLRGLRAAVLARDKKEALDTVAQASAEAQVHSAALTELKGNARIAKKRARDAVRLVAQAEADLAANEEKFQVARDSLEHVDRALRQELEEKRALRMTEFMELELNEGTLRLQLLMRERQVFASVMDDFATPFAEMLPPECRGMDSQDMLVSFRDEIQTKRREVEELEQAAALAMDGLAEVDPHRHNNPQSSRAPSVSLLELEERVFELEREERQIDHRIRATVSVARSVGPSLPHNQHPQQSPVSGTAATARSRGRRAVAAEPSKSPGGIMQSTLRALQDVRARYSPALSRRSPATPRQRIPPQPSAGGGRTPMASPTPTVGGGADGDSGTDTHPGGRHTASRIRRGGIQRELSYDTAPTSSPQPRARRPAVPRR